MTEQNTPATDQDFYRWLLNGLPDQILVVDDQYRIIDANVAYLRALGMSREDVIGRHCYHLTYPGANACDHTAGHTCPVYAVWETNSPATKLRIVQDQHGKKRFFEVMASPLLDHHGRIQAVIETHRDVTTKRQLESALAAIYDLGQELILTQDEGEITKAVVQAIKQILHFEVCSISLIQDNQLVVVESLGYSEPDDTINLDLDGELGITVAVARSGESLYIPDVRQDPRYVTGGNFTAVSELAVPLKIGDRVLGVLNIESDQFDSFDQADERRLTTLADVAAVALESTRAYHREQHRLAEMSALYQLGLMLVAEQDPTIIAKHIVDKMGDFLQIETAVICLLDEDGDYLVTFGMDRGDVIHQTRLSLDGSSFSARVVQTGQALTVNNIKQHDLPIRGVFIGEPCHSWLGVPLRLEDRIFGVVAIETYSDLDFDADTEQLLTQIAAQVAPVLENVRLYQQTKLRMAEMETLFTVTASISSDLSLHYILPSVAKELATAVDAASCLISRWDPASRTLLLSAEYVHPDRQGKKHPPQNPGTVLQLDHYPIIETALITRQPFTVAAGDPACTPDELEVLKEFNWGSLLALPMIASGQVIGLVELYDTPASREFSTREIRLAQTLANQAAIAINRAQLFEETNRRLLREEQLTRFVHTIGSEMYLENLIPRLLPLMVELTGADAGTIVVYDDERQISTRIFLHNLPASLMSSKDPAEPGVASSTIDHKQIVMLDDYRDHPNAQPTWIGAGVRSTLGVPLLVEDQVVGSLGLFSLDQIRRFGLESVASAEAMAQLAAMAIQRARLFQAEQQQRQQAEALRDASLILGAALDTDKILERLLDQIHRVIPYDAANVMWIENDVVRITHQRGYEALGTAEATANLRLSLDQAHNLQEMVASHRPNIIPDPQNHPDWLDFESTRWIRSWAGAPIMIRDEVIGFFSLDSKTPGFYTEEHASILAAFANQAAVSIENANLYQAEQKRRQQTTSLNHLTRRLSRGLTFNQLFDSFAADVKALVEFDRASIALAIDPDNPTETEFIMHTIFDRPGAPLSEGFTMPVKASAAYPDLLEGRAHLTKDLADELDYVTERFLYDGGLRSRVNLPLVVRGQTIGTLNLASRETHCFHEDQLPLLQQIADAVAVAVDNSRLYEAVQKQAADLEKEVRKRTAELRAERDRTQAILDSAAEGVVVADQEGIIQYINPAMEQLCGYSLDEAIGQTTDLWTSGHHPPEFYQEMWKIILDGNTWEGEIINQRKNGSFYDALVTIAPILGPDNSVSGFVGIQQDISDRKELDRMKDQFVSNVSHELRTPLTNLKLYLKLLEQGKPGKRHQYLATLDREANRLQRLIEDLLSLSRLNVGTVQTHRTAVNLNTLVGQLVEDRKALAAERGLQLDTELAAGLPPVLADEKMLGQVITNLMTNAMNYTLAGGRIAAHTAVRTKDKAKWITVSIIDTGFGISKEEQKHLFERFYRGEAAERARAAGTGLGLAISQEMINQLNGLITVDSELGKGSDFTVWLPPAMQ